MNNIKFFILAGGYGTRTRPLSLIKPKPVFPLGGTPLLRIILDQLREKELTNGFVNLHHLPDAVRECVETVPHNPGVRFFYEERLSGSQILKDALPYLEEEEALLVLNGDIFLDIPVARMAAELEEEEADGVLLVRRNSVEGTSYNAVLEEDGFFNGRKFFHPDRPFKNALMYTGVALLKPSVLRAIDEINFFDSLEKQEQSFRIKLVEYEGIWLDIGDPKSYMESDRRYKEHVGETGTNSFSEEVIVSGDSVVEDSIIWENTEIRKGSVIRGCIVTGGIVLDNAHNEDRIIMSNDGKMMSCSLLIKSRII